MAVTQTETRQEMGRVLAEAIGQDQAVHELWVTTKSDCLHFWLVTGPIEREDELRLYGLYDILDDQFPDTEYQIHLLNERYFPGGARAAVPEGADEIPLRTI